MARRSAKLLSLVLGLLVPLGLVALLFLALVKPFNLISQLVVLLSKYRKLLPYMIAQARHETNDFKSNIYKSHRNMFGMKHPSQRKAVGEKGDQAPDGGYYQKYSSQVQSVRDLLLWMDAVRFPVAVGSAAEYVSKLDDLGDGPGGRSYFGDARIYLNGMNRFLTAA